MLLKSHCHKIEIVTPVKYTDTKHKVVSILDQKLDLVNLQTPWIQFPIQFNNSQSLLVTSVISCYEFKSNQNK